MLFWIKTNAERSKRFLAATPQACADGGSRRDLPQQYA